ncbi:tRNA1(Val) (adenine(37)-N6)-methyltransferase [Bowmanella denitrificans]|uniref:tRNA1(Val) (adenine(37)-N6)-methyltransferase n=1 Tax=Bowmanella denitrificans TaxID=366582 RepID=A0ABN0XDW5_9ALTE
MPERRPGFAFKQFFVAHDQCAMKVGTDSIVLGSWVNPNKAQTILDIGTGSGLLALMMAQKSHNEVQILGIDIDHNAITQARDNARLSPWPHKLVFEQRPLQQLQQHKHYDLIISNPPYFPHGQQFARQRQQARHTSELEHSVLIAAVAGLLTRQGRFAYVLPVKPAETLIELGKTVGLLLQRCLLLQSQPDKAPVRMLVELAAKESQPVIETLCIHQSDSDYSQAYRQLCRDFYLNF